jgi:hypothetical protein
VREVGNRFVLSKGHQRQAKFPSFVGRLSQVPITDKSTTRKPSPDRALLRLAEVSSQGGKVVYISSLIVDMHKYVSGRFQDSPWLP